MKRLIAFLSILAVACGAPESVPDLTDAAAADSAPRGDTNDGAVSDTINDQCCLEGTDVETVSALEPPVFSTTWTTAPSDGTQVKASDVRQEAQASFTNDAFLRVKRYTWSYSYENPAFTFNIFSSTSYDTPFSGGYVDIPGAKVDDVIYVRLVCTAQNGQPSTGNGNRLRLAAIDDFGGGGETSPAEVPGARTYINAPDEQMVSIAIEGHWVVTVDGTTRIRMEGRVDSGGGELRIQSAAYLRAEHSRAPIDGETP